MAHEQKLIDSRLVIWSILFSLFSVIYVDTWSRGAAGTLVSVVIFLLVAGLALFRTHLAILSTIILQITIPAFPRDIIDVYTALQVDKTVSYNTICSISVAKLSLIQHLTFLVAAIVLYKLLLANRELYVGKNFKLYLGALFATTLVATLYFSFTQNENPNIREIATNIRLPLFLCCGLIYFSHFYHWLGIEAAIRFINRMLVAITIIMGVRVPLFLLSGIREKIPSLDLGVVPHIPIAVVLTSFYLIEHDRPNRRSYLLLLVLSMFALLSPSRGHMAILVLSAAVYLFVTGWNIRYLKYLGAVAAMFVLPVLFVFFTNERLFDFILWKLTFFSGNVSDSGRVRLFEFRNILAEALNNPPYMLFGKGLTGFFTFSEYPLPAGIELDLKSYTQDEIALGRFYHPHFFINFILLKYGMLGLIIYTGMVLDYFRSALRVARAARVSTGSSLQASFFTMTSAILSVSMLLEMFFRNYYALVFAMSLPLLYLLKQHHPKLQELQNEDTVPVA